MQTFSLTVKTIFNAQANYAPRDDPTHANIYWQISKQPFTRLNACIFPTEKGNFCRI